MIAIAKETFRDQAVSLVVLGPTKEEDLDLGCLSF